MVFCHSCGHAIIVSDARFCSKCGTNIILFGSFESSEIPKPSLVLLFSTVTASSSPRPSSSPCLRFLLLFFISKFCFDFVFKYLVGSRIELEGIVVEPEGSFVEIKMGDRRGCLPKASASRTPSPLYTSYSFIFANRQSFSPSLILHWHLLKR